MKTENTRRTKIKPIIVAVEPIVHSFDIPMIPCQ